MPGEMPGPHTERRGRGDPRLPRESVAARDMAGYRERRHRAEAEQEGE